MTLEEEGIIKLWDCELYCGDCVDILRNIEADSVDLMVTDPPYGMSFMGKDWDKAVPKVEIWKECLRVLKPGAFAFIMCIPRQDCLARMIVNLGDAGFETGFTSMYWTNASGFPKAGNIGKQVDKRMGAEREVVGQYKSPEAKTRLNTVSSNSTFHNEQLADPLLTAPSTPEAKALDGSYAGFQPKPAVEVILCVMKPLAKKTYVDQALENGKGITWLDDCRVPYASESDVNDFSKLKRVSNHIYGGGKGTNLNINPASPAGRFPANLLVSDDVLNDGKVSGAHGGKGRFRQHTWMEEEIAQNITRDSGSFSRYFDLDAWAKTLPFLICPKASKGEKNKGLSGEKNPIPYSEYRENYDVTKSYVSEYPDGKPRPMNKAINNHPTVKPLKLMSYLITLGSREGDTILDPFMGSGTTCLAAQNLERKCIGIEISEDYFKIAEKRCARGGLGL